MLPFFIYWGVILACIAWLALSVYFSVFYLVRKENGNLWAFALFNVIAAIVLAITLAVYRTWGWGITQYSSLIYLILAIYGVVVLLQAILGREPKKAEIPQRFTVLAISVHEGGHLSLHLPHMHTSCCNI